MCSSFTPFYFAISYIKYHMAYKNVAGPTCIPWNAAYIFCQIMSFMLLARSATDIYCLQAIIKFHCLVSQVLLHFDTPMLPDSLNH